MNAEFFAKRFSARFAANCYIVTSDRVSDTFSHSLALNCRRQRRHFAASSPEMYIRTAFTAAVSPRQATAVYCSHISESVHSIYRVFDCISPHTAVYRMFISVCARLRTCDVRAFTLSRVRCTATECALSVRALGGQRSILLILSVCCKVSRVFESALQACQILCVRVCAGGRVVGCRAIGQDKHTHDRNAFSFMLRAFKLHAMLCNNRNCAKYSRS